MVLTGGETDEHTLKTQFDIQTMKRRSVHGAVATFASQGIRFVLQFGSQVVLARLLLPADFGLIAMVGPVLSFVQIFSELGLSQAAIQKPDITQGELSALFWINAAISVVMASLMIAVSPLVAIFYGQPHLLQICMSVSCLLVVSGLSAQHIALITRQMQFTALATIDVSCAAFAAAAGIGAALLGMGYWSLVLMQAVNAITISILAWFLSGWRPSRPRRETGVGAILRFGGHLTGYNVISFMGTNCDSILIGKIAGSVGLGLYDRAFKLVAAPIWQISLPMARVAVSLLSRLQLSPERYRSAFLRMLQILLLLTMPAVAWVAITADTLVPLLFGPTWAAAAPIVSALAIATGFAPLSISSYWLFVSQNRAAEQLRYIGIKTAIAFAALLAGLPWGALGVARSYAVFGLLVHGSLLWGATKRGPVTRKAVWHASYPVIIAAGAAATMLLMCEQRIGAVGLPAFYRLAVEAVLSYLACCLALLCLPGGFRVLSEIWQLRAMFKRVSNEA
jgi:polysaccharide transporter, PST family